MPTFYNFRQNGVDYSFDDVFVPADLFRDGTLFAWGSDIGNGRLGNATVSITASTPVTTFAGGSNWKQVSIGLDINSRHSAAIKTDGTLWIWGSAASGRLGNGATSVNRSTPVTTFAGGSNWKQVSIGYAYTAAIKTDGTLWTWGNGLNGQLGNNDTTDRSTPITTFAGGNNWKQVNVGPRFSVAIKTDGTLWTWGTGTNGQLGNNDTTDRSTPITTFAGGNNWKQVSSGDVYTAAIKTDGTLWVWGNQFNGKLGNAVTTGNISTAVTTFAGGNNWKQVSSGNDHISAIKTDGTLWTWGSGSNGRLGNASISNRSTPITTFAGGTNWKQVSGGSSHTAAIKTDGTLWTWGLGLNGQLGNASSTNTNSTPLTTFAGGTNWKQVSGGGNHTAAVTYDDPVL
jgi:alpha-tubulin suppressor-like RCC1 family protein